MWSGGILPLCFCLAQIIRGTSNFEIGPIKNEGKIVVHLNHEKGRHMMTNPNPTSPLPISIYRTSVQPEWIDYNQHMNDGFYAVAFGLAGGEFQDEIGMDADYRAQTQNTLYTVEAHISYLRELKVGHAIHITHQLLGVDYKRLHLFQRMFHTEENYLAATMEVMYLHVNQEIGRSTAIPEAYLSPLQALAAEHSKLELPSQMGRAIGMPKKG